MGNVLILDAVEKGQQTNENYFALQENSNLIWQKQMSCIISKPVNYILQWKNIIY